MQENNLKIKDNNIHVWQASLSQSDSLYKALTETLAAGELARADRFKFEKDRRRYSIGRGILRNILGRYREVEPASLEFAYSDHGKPFLADAASDSLYFNLSHSADQMLLAVGHHAELGIDVEFMRRNIELLDIAKRFFSANELGYIMQQPSTQLRELFFSCWTRKEAFIKAVGSGLSFPLESFAVDLSLDENISLLKTEWDEDERFEWTLLDIPVDVNYKAAVAIKSKDVTVKRFTWKES